MCPKVFEQKEKVLGKKFKKLEKEYIKLQRLDRRVYRINFLIDELTQESCDLVDEYQGITYSDERVECA